MALELRQCFCYHPLIQTRKPRKHWSLLNFPRERGGWFWSWRHGCSSYQTIDWVTMQTFSCSPLCHLFSTYPDFLERSNYRGIYRYVFHHSKHDMTNIRLSKLVLELEDWPALSNWVKKMTQHELWEMENCLKTCKGATLTNALNILFTLPGHTQTGSRALTRYKQKRQQRLQLIHETLDHLLPMEIIDMIFMANKD